MFRRIFFASVAVLLLSIAYHLGASVADAVSPTYLWHANYLNFATAVLNDRTITVATFGNNYLGEAGHTLAPILGTAPVVAFDAIFAGAAAGASQDAAVAILAGGIVYYKTPGNAGWTLEPPRLPALGVPSAGNLHTGLDLVVGPNPGRDGQLARFALPVPEHVRLEIFDLQGRHLSTIADDDLAAGSHSIPLGAALRGTSSGVVFLRLTAGQQTVTRRITELR